MKRLWLGIAILAVLLGLSIGVQAAMDKLHSPIAQNLEKAAEYALDDNWEQANKHFAQARHTWQRYHGASACVADHSPMDELDMLFAEIGVFSREQETVHFASTCRSAAQMATAMHQAHSFTWWNLL